VPGKTYWVRAFAGAAILTALSVSAAYAIYPQLSTKLSGPAINGVTPEGDAKLDQSKLPEQPGRLEVKVQNVNLPDGTLLSVILTDAGSHPVGTITLSRGSGQLFTTVQAPIGRTSSIFVRLGSTTVLSGGSPWKV
jgi:hypothetical protein